MNGKDPSEACPGRESELEEYLFEELDPAGRESLEEHLQECPGCRQALHQARLGLEALRDLEVAPAPFAEGGETGEADEGKAGEAWREFLRRCSLPGGGSELQGSGDGGDDEVPFRREGPGRRRWLQPLAAAALLLVGLGLGRWLAPAPDPEAGGTGSDLVISAGGFRVEAEAVDALVRAELLADLGMTWVEDVLVLVGEVLEIDSASPREAVLERLRSSARRLIQDGRLLTRRLDPGRDGVFLTAIGRAEIILEDVAGIGTGEEADWSLGQIKSTLAMSDLDERLIALDMDAAVTDAIEASGWIGEEYRAEMMSREVRR
jgi:hypothetical protein